MASNRIKGITIEINGETTKLQKALGEVDRSLKNTQSSLRDVDRLLKLDPKNTELLKQKQDMLGGAVQDVKKKIDAEKEALKQMDASGVDRTSKEYQALQRDIVANEQELKNLNKELKTFGSVGVQQAKIVGDKMAEVGQKMSNVGGKMTMGVTLPIAAAGVAVVNSASDMEENLNKVDVAFGNSAESVKAWSETATTQFGLSKNAALESTSLFGDMATSMGLSQQEAAEMSINLAGLAGDLSSFKNVGIDQAMTALNGVFTGETESLKQLGVVMTETNLEEFASRQGLVYKEMSQAEKVSLRYQYVLEQTKNAQGDYARTSDGTANSIRTAKAEFENLSAELGENLLPIITPIIKGVSDLLKKFGEMDGDTQKIILTIIGLVAALGPVVSVVGNVIKLGGFLAPLIPAIGTALSTVGTVLTGTMLPAIGSVLGALAPFLPIIAAIVAAVVAVIAIVKNWGAITDWFSEKFSALGDFLGEKIEAIKGFFSGLGDKIGEIKDGIVTKFGEMKDEVSARWDAIFQKTSEVWGNIKAKVEENGGGIKGVLTTAMEGYKTLWSNGFNKLNEISGGKLGEMAGKFRGKFEEIKGSAGDFVENIKSKFNFNWSLPHINIPHFNVSGGKAPWGFGGQGSLPRINVDWYAKAMKNGMILNRPTIFGAMNGKLLGAGEAGSEAIVGVNSLYGMIQNAMDSRDDKIVGILSQYLPDIANKQVVLDTGATVGQLASPMDKALGNLQSKQARYI